MKQFLFISFALVLLLFIGTLSAKYKWESVHPSFSDYGQAPAFSLVSSEGKTISNKDLSGKVWVLSFFFSTCDSICPKVNKALSKTQALFKDTDDVAFVSISVDPENDTNEALTRYAKTLHADPEKWHFLRGNEKEVTELYHALKLGAGDKAAEHSSRVVLFDRNQHIRGYYLGTDGEAMRKLTGDIDALRALEPDPKN